MVQSIAVLRGKNHSAVITALIGQMAAADGATHKTVLLFSSGITQKTTIKNDNSFVFIIQSRQSKRQGSAQRFATVYAVLLR
jgi:hypothetical protein